MLVSQNSLEKNILHLYASLFTDIARHHPHLKNSIQRDFKTLVERTNHEGLSFLTVSLPKLGKAIYRSLETRCFICPSNFRKCKGTELPRLLSGFLKTVFEDCGQLRLEPDVVVLNDLIQILFLVYKLEIPYSLQKEEGVINAFRKTEEDLSRLCLEDDDPILEVAAKLAYSSLRGFNPMEIEPQHGPGAVATGEKAHDKWQFSRKYNSLHKVYPYYEYFVPSRGSLLRSIPSYRKFESLESGTARVVLVPKDSRGPRLISMEPLEYQFIQQGLGRALVRFVETKSPLTSGSVNFTDQNTNRDLSRWNSVTRSYATLDMKEASDRVSVALVERVFGRLPKLLKCLLATRTSATELPNGDILPLRKFAPMGSALCFPVEALVFFFLAYALKARHRIPGRVYVYGDDIIVPRALAPLLFEHFPKYGLMFNEDKCFIEGYFRESCGLDAFSGNVVTPIRMKKLLPSNGGQASLIGSTVELSNNLYLRGFWSAAESLETFINSLPPIREKGKVTDYRGVHTYRSPKHSFGGLSWCSYTVKTVITQDKVRYNKFLHRFESYSSCLRSVNKRYYPENPEGRLFKSVLGRHRESWEIIAVPHAATIKMRWSLLY